MVETDIWGLHVRMQGSIVALMAYADEFGSDFNQDFRSAYLHSGSPSVSFLLKAAWAMAKGADASTPSFAQWTSYMGDRIDENGDFVKGGFTLAEIGNWDGWPHDVDSAIAAEMFRGGLPS